MTSGADDETMPKRKMESNDPSDGVPPLLEGSSPPAAGRAGHPAVENCAFALTDARGEVWPCGHPTSWAKLELGLEATQLGHAQLGDAQAGGTHLELQLPKLSGRFRTIRRPASHLPATFPPLPAYPPSPLSASMSPSVPSPSLISPQQLRTCCWHLRLRTL